MVLQIFADGGRGVHDIQAQGLQASGIAKAGQLEELGRLDGACAQDHFAARQHLLDPAAALYLDPDRPLVFKQNAPGAGLGEQL